jgi:hypothetical protein
MRHYWLTSDAPELPANAFQRAPGLKRPATLEGGGKGGGGSAPSYPDPNTVAQATTQTNENTAAYNKALNLNNYTNPFGSQQTVQTGTDPNTGAPIYSTNVSANPQLTGALNGLLGSAGDSGAINASAFNGLSNLEYGYQGLNSGLRGLQGQFQGINSGVLGLGNQLNQGQAAQAGQQGQNAAYAAQTQYLDPQFSQQKESLDAQLANQGITPGSQAYNNAMTNYNNQKQQAYSNAQNQSILTGSQIGAQSLQNQISGINTQAGLFGLAGSNLGQQAGLYGQQGANLGAQAGLYGQQTGIGQLPYSNIQTIAGMIPGYSGTSQSAASPADIAGLYNNQYQSQLAGYNAGQSSSNNMMGGLFGLGSAFLSGGGGSSIMSMFSDRRLKRDIKRIGTWSNGLGVYAYRYVWEKAARHIGFMADEVRRIAPVAVLRGDDGYDRVNYVLAVR